MQVDQDLYCRKGFEADGEVRLLGAHIGGRLVLTGGKFRNPGGNAIYAGGVTVNLGMYCGEEFEAAGRLRMRGAQIGRALDLTGGEFRNPDCEAINAEGLNIVGVGFWRPVEVIGKLNLQFARATVWADNSNGRAAPTMLGGFQYDALYPGPEQVDPDERIEWLGRDPTGYSPQPYEQLAGVYRRGGDEQAARMAARRVGIAKQKKRRALNKRWWVRYPSRAWSAFLRWTIGYGYQPARALVPLAVLFAVGWAIFDAAHPEHLNPAKKGAEQPGFSPVRYTADLLLPVVNFKQRDAFVSKLGRLGVIRVHLRGLAARCRRRGRPYRRLQTRLTAPG